MPIEMALLRNGCLVYKGSQEKWIGRSDNEDGAEDGKGDGYGLL